MASTHILAVENSDAMREIHLTQGKTAIVDAADYELLKAFKWQAFAHHNNCYAMRREKVGFKKYVTIYMHRMIVGAQPGELVDHINRNGLDNTRSNLRIATTSQNGHNRIVSRNSQSGYKGIHWDKRWRKWVASIRVNGKRYYLGASSTPEGAARLYDAKALELHGEFARLNFPLVQPKIVRDGIEMDVSMPPWVDPQDGLLQAMIDAGRLQEPPSRDDRADESAALYDNARYYEWLKAEREDYEEYLRDVEWMRLGC